ncbi:NAC domain-containing protein 41-like [Alnus glutinosa]|uniref:NAC domain-containing protein 41-like n=1 Tax=Alnus glutinosa TaxID=3517 RepID=UPI002D771A2F|nr:NAC domain-containing protein 41-like [Alnus glutinosa]XP_062173470.1 NAC domain-containing protein 41-like [Alnus glutinosa]XP_062173471.1 NAC domain-containing protein 41-like [Alnus glutinosa]
MGANRAMLPLGFRFMPTDEELISHYLVKKVKGEELSWDGIPDCDLYGEKPPWEICGDQEKVYFFTTLKKLSKNRVSRTAGCGVWHENCTVKIYDNRGDIIGARKLFNFNVKEGSTTKNSNWIMHEFSLVGEQQQGTNLVLCSLQKKGSESSSGVKRRFEEESHQRKRVCCNIVECPPPQAIWIPAESNMETIMGCLPSSDPSDFNFDLETIRSIQPPEVGDLPPEGGDLPILPPLEDFWDADWDALFA